MDEVNKSNSRIAFLDNLRASAIIFVVLFHCSVPYSVLFGPRLDFYILSPANLIFDGFCILCDTLFMPALFFVAGYFALPSLLKRSIGSYIKNKFLHLLVPFFIGVLLLNAFPNYLKAHLSQGHQEGYLQYWLNYCKNLPVEFASNKASVHLWFLSLLFLFYCVLALGYAINKRLFTQSYNVELPTRTLLFSTSLVCFIGFICVNLFYPDYTNWKNFAYLWTFQSTRVTTYAVYFCLGIVAFKKQWFEGKRLIQPYFWAVVALITTLCNIVFQISHFSEIDKVLWVNLIHAFLHCFSCIALLITYLNFSKKWMNAADTFSKKLSTNSYAIYILHFNIFLLIEWSLLTTSLPVFLKFSLAGIGTYLLAFIISEYLLKRIPYLKRVLY